MQKAIALSYNETIYLLCIYSYRKKLTAGIKKVTTSSTFTQETFQLLNEILSVFAYMRVRSKLIKLHIVITFS